MRLGTSTGPQLRTGASSSYPSWNSADTNVLLSIDGDSLKFPSPGMTGWTTSVRHPSPRVRAAVDADPRHEVAAIELVRVERGGPTAVDPQPALRKQARSAWMHRSAFGWRLIGPGLGEFRFGRADVPV